MVRPFGLIGPILVLLIALPLLRPLRHPSEAQTSEQEALRLATVRALVEHGSLVLDRSYALSPGTVQVTDPVYGQRIYSTQPPMMALLLWPAAEIMTLLGLTFEENHLLIAYLLTMLAATLPVAAAAGFIYKMGRLFELRRPWRTLLGIGVVVGSGLLSYAVVLNPHAPSAALVIASAYALIHVAAMNREDRRAGWFALSGACVALAATIDPPAVVFLVLFGCVIFAMRFTIPRRAVGVFLYILGAIPVLSVHAAWNAPVTGDFLPASTHKVLHSQPAAPTVFSQDYVDDDFPETTSIWDTPGAHLRWLLTVMFGPNGLLSHFPVLILGMMGIAAVMHRHWPGSTKTLAAACGAGAIVVVLFSRQAPGIWSGTFASTGFILFSPILLFWTGAWLRRTHTPVVWGLATVLLIFSMAVGLIGATGPTPREPFRGYTAGDALRRLIHPHQADLNNALAGRAP